MSKRVADLVVDTLQASGVRTCYGIVGDTLNRIAHAIDRSEIDWVHMRHEEAGAFAAGSEALLTGHPDRDANHPPGYRVRIDPRNRPQRRIQRLQRLLRDDSHTGAGPAKNRCRLPSSPDQT